MEGRRDGDISRYHKVVVALAEIQVDLFMNPRSEQLAFDSVRDQNVIDPEALATRVRPSGSCFEERVGCC